MRKFIVNILIVVFISIMFFGCEEKLPDRVYEYNNSSQFVGTGEENGFEYILYSDYAEVVVCNLDVNETQVVFPATLGGKPVRVIKGSILENNVAITSVEIPPSVEEIGSHAFSGCTSLEKVAIPKSVKKIGSNAFFETDWIKTLSGEFVTVGDGVLIKYNGKGGDIKIPTKVKYISNAFENNQRITTIDIPNSVVGIGDFAFYNCISLTEVQIPNGIYDIGAYAFGKSTWLDVMNEDFVVVGNGVLIDYRGTQTEITIPDNVKYICGAFYEDEVVVSVKIPNSVKLVSGSSFFGCKELKTVEFLGADTEIVGSVFYGCKKLTTVKLPENLKILSNSIFYNCINLENVTLPKSLSFISIGAFYNCKKLESLNIPNQVVEIGNGAFLGCLELKNIELPQSILKLGKAAFAGCVKLSNIVLPQNVSQIPEGLFSDCEALSEVKLNENVKFIGSSAFGSCDNITVYIPSKDTVLSTDCFLECTQTAQIYCRENSPAHSFAEMNNIKFFLY